MPVDVDKKADPSLRGVFWPALRVGRRLHGRGGGGWDRRGRRGRKETIDLRAPERRLLLGDRYRSR
ncbi:MAG: hypothetical protein ACPLRW_02190 [Moorellales bacterium]